MFPTVLHSALSQSDSELFGAIMRLVGGSAVAGVLFGAVWALVTGKVLPRWFFDRLDKLYDAERLARIATEARLDQLIAALNKAVGIAEATQTRIDRLGTRIDECLKSLENGKQPPRQEGSTP
jgi:hypothetical protein